MDQSLAVDALVLSALRQIERKADNPQQQAHEEPTPRSEVAHAFDLTFFDADGLGVNQDPDAGTEHKKQYQLFHETHPSVVIEEFMVP